MTGIYVISAELSGRFTSRPNATLRDMMIGAASRAIRTAGVNPEDLDALYAGAMGNFEPEGFVGPIPIRLSNVLRLRNADITPMLVGSSEAGAWVLRQAYEAMKRGDAYRNVLVVAGEQMNPLAEESARSGAEQLAERVARNHAIGEILDAQELRHGLNMVRMGDLTMDGLRTSEGWHVDDLRETILPLISLNKYERVAGYPMGQLHGKTPGGLRGYRAAGRLSRYFNLHDVSPTSSGAVALVLSREPRGNALEIMGMGQAIAPLSLTARRGDPRRALSMRHAVVRACRDGEVDIQWLLDCDFALLHDAFVSIELSFLRELELTPADMIARAIGGWSNPFGGLKTCGHALGASGLLQIAKAHHRMFLDARYLSPAAQRLPPVHRCFATSVGGPLTNVVVSLLQKAGATNADRAMEHEQVERYERRTVEGDEAYERMRGAIPLGCGMVLLTTQIRHHSAFGDDVNCLLQAHPDPWISLLERARQEDTEGPKTYAFSDRELSAGDVVALEPVSLEGESFDRVVRVVDRIEMPVRMGEEEREEVLARCREELARFGSA